MCITYDTWIIDPQKIMAIIFPTDFKTSISSVVENTIAVSVSRIDRFLDNISVTVLFSIAIPSLAIRH